MDRIQIICLPSVLSGLVLCVFGLYIIPFTKYNIYTEKRRLKWTNYPPGPKRWPVLGNLFIFRRLFKNPEKELTKLAHQYGSVCMLWFGSQPVMIINKAQDVKQLLDKKGAIYSDRPVQNSFREQAWPWRIVTTGVGEKFRLLRRVYNNLLSPQQSASLHKYQDYESKIMLRDLLSEPEAFLDHAKRFALSVIFSAVYGVRLVQLDHPTMVEFYRVWEDSMKYFQPGTLLVDYLPILQRLPKFLQPWLRLATELQTRDSALHRAFLGSLKLQVEAGNEPRCFGSDLVRIQDKEGLDDEKVLNILAMLIGAGSDTTSSMLQSFFKVMALHPEAVRAAHKELDQIVGPTRLPTWEDEPNLPYVRALIKEVHRWAPIGSLGIPHATTSNDIHCGLQVPKGTIVFPNLTSLNRDPERYEDPDIFMPDRFLGDNLHANASASHPDFRRRDHFHYGFGRRLCQGLFFSESSLFIVISRALWAFNISPTQGEPPLYMNDKISGLVIKPTPYRVSITPRSAATQKVIEESAATARTDILDFDSIEVVGGRRMRK